MRRNAFTLIELIIAVAIVGIAFYAVISVFISVIPWNVNVEDLSRATYLANRVIEETATRDFDSVVSVAQTKFASPFDKFMYEVIAEYVTTAEPNVVSMAPTPYKRVKVKVWGGKSGTPEVTTLLTSYAQ